MKLKLLISLLLLTTISMKAQQVEKNKKSFTVEQANANYFKAVRNRNLEVMLSYVTKSNEIPFVMGDGALKKTKKEYKDFHISWFSDNKWDMDIEIMNIAKNGTTALITGKTNYYADKKDKNKIDNLIVTMIYAKEDGMWKVIGDICSAIEKK